jgi:hypothetical protein
MNCKYGATDANECAMMRERSVAGSSDSIPSCDVHSVRVELHPATDAWMRGDRYGELVDTGHGFGIIRMDRSGRDLKVSNDLYTVIW